MKNLEKIVFKLIDEKIVDCDRYKNKGSLWLIFTNKKSWVLEYTGDGILWYNYHFFSGIFSLLGLNDERNEYITKWFELRFLNKPKVEDTIQNGVKHTILNFVKDCILVEDTIQNGVKETLTSEMRSRLTAENIIENGVRHTLQNPNSIKYEVEDIIQNGVKHTKPKVYRAENHIEDTIQNGVKRTSHFSSTLPSDVEDTIQNGVKNVKSMCGKRGGRVDYIIENSVKEIDTDFNNPNSYHHKWTIDWVIQDGIKEIQPLPAQDGNRDWGNYYNRQEDRTKSFNHYLNDTIENGVKQ